MLPDFPKQATLTFTTELFEDQGPAEFSLLLSDMKVTLPQMLILSNTDKIGDAVLEETDDMGNPLVVRNHILYVPSKNAENGIFSITLNIYGLCAGEIRPDGTNNFQLTPSTDDENILDIINNKFVLNGDASVQLALKGPGTTLAAQTQVRTDFIIEELEITRVAGLIDARPMSLSR